MDEKNKASVSTDTAAAAVDDAETGGVEMVKPMQPIVRSTPYSFLRSLNNTFPNPNPSVATQVSKTASYSFQCNLYEKTRFSMVSRGFSR